MRDSFTNQFINPPVLQLHFFVKQGIYFFSRNRKCFMDNLDYSLYNILQLFQMQIDQLGIDGNRKLVNLYQVITTVMEQVSLRRETLMSLKSFISNRLRLVTNNVGSKTDFQRNEEMLYAYFYEYQWITIIQGTLIKNQRG